MVLPEIRLLQAAIALAEELNFSRAAARLRIDQSTLSKRIMELEGLVGLRLFERNHQLVELTEPGRHFVQEARNALLHTERAVLSATAAARGADEVLNLGKSAYTDPFLVTTLQSVQLPLYPGLRVKLWSNYSHELAHMVAAGKLLPKPRSTLLCPKRTLLQVAKNCAWKIYKLASGFSSLHTSTRMFSR
jgi:DNA-binding transcriptional LysR family regulator